eukprot:3870816-Rhodomonas_salina.3
MSGTNLAYALAPYAAAMPCPVLTSRMVPPAYALAMRCPVLTERMLLPMSGESTARAGEVQYTVLGYAATDVLPVCGTERPRART